MELNRRHFAGGLAALSLCRPVWAAEPNQGLFWKVSRNGQSSAIVDLTGELIAISSVGV